MNNKTARFIQLSEGQPATKKKKKRKSKIDRSMYCAELENVGRHIFDINPAGKHMCRYCGMQDPAMTKPTLELV